VFFLSTKNKTMQKTKDEEPRAAQKEKEREV
jgi:hypothetical protein